MDDLISRQMTVEELKREAKALGYKLVKTPSPMEKLLPCRCGGNRRTKWYGINVILLECQRCGAKAQGKNEREARHNWNEMMRGENDE